MVTPHDITFKIFFKMFFFFFKTNMKMAFFRTWRMCFKMIFYPPYFPLAHCYPTSKSKQWNTILVGRLINSYFIIIIIRTLLPRNSIAVARFITCE